MQHAAGRGFMMRPSPAASCVGCCCGSSLVVRWQLTERGRTFWTQRANASKVKAEVWAATEHSACHARHMHPAH